MKITARASHCLKTLVLTVVRAYEITLLLSKGNDYHFHLREKLCMIIRIGGFAVSLEFNMLGVKIIARASHCHKTLVTNAVEAY